MNEPEQPTVRIASGDELRVRGFSVKQAMNDLFTIEVVALSENGDVDFDAVIGHAAAFSLAAPDAAVLWTGVCSEVRQVRWEAGGLSTYRLVIVPRAWLLTQRRNYRIFQMKSELDIVRQVLAEAGVTVACRVDAAMHVPRKYRVQYAESDFAFVSRMMEDAGLNYYFETWGDETVMVLDDAPQSRAAGGGALAFGDEADPRVRHATQLSVTQRVRPGRVTLGDLDYRRPSDAQPRFAAAGGLGVEQVLEQFHYEPGAALYRADGGGSTPVADDRGAARTSSALGAAKTERRLHGARNAAKQIQLRTNAVDLVPGVVTTVLGHPHRAVAGQSLLVVGATIEGDGADARTAEVTLAPTDQPYLPEQKTPRPKVQGLESATVVGPEGEAIHTDEYGRIRVHFHWDREGDYTEQDSCWVPSSQSGGGGAFGGVSLPRVGQEVLVEFLGGDPDRPVAIGRVFTEAQPPPYKLPDYRHVSGMRSDPGPRLMAGAADGGVAGPSDGPDAPGTPYSMQEIGQLATQRGTFQAISPNGATHSCSSNEQTYDDTHGSELAYSQAQKDAHSLVKNSKVSVIGNSRACTVGTNDHLNVEHAQQIDIGASQVVNIGADRTWFIRGDVSQGVEHNYTLGANDSIVHSTAGFIDYGATGEITIHSDTKITLQVGDSSITLTPDNITIQSGDRVDINPMQGTQEYMDKKAAEEAQAAAAKAKADRIQYLQNAIKSNQDALDKGYPNREAAKNEIRNDTTELRALRGERGPQ